jgi:hypothetical protein
MRKITIVFLFFTLVSFGQNMDEYQWKNRVLLVFADEKNSDNLKLQIQVLENNKAELKERKIVVYKILPSLFNFNFEDNWQSSSKYFKKFNPNKTKFKVMLIGLDGGIKLEQAKILSTEKLFVLIDGMPMRKREIRN